MKTSKIDNTIKNLQQAIVNLTPGLSFLFIDEILDSVSFDETLTINQEIFKTYPDEVTNIINHIVKKTDINKPEQSQKYFFNMFNDLFDNVEEVKSFKESDYELEYRNVLQLNQENNKTNNIIQSDHKKNHINQIESIKSKLKNIDISEFYNKLDVLKNALFYSVNRIKETIESINPHLEKAENYIDIDLSDMSYSEKIIFINELGIIDFIRKTHPYISNNKLASIITGITGMNHRTAQSYINPIINTACRQDKNPYHSTKTVEKVKKKINALDFKKLHTI